LLASTGPVGFGVGVGAGGTGLSEGGSQPGGTPVGGVVTTGQAGFLCSPLTSLSLAGDGLLDDDRLPPEVDRVAGARERGGLDRRGVPGAISTISDRRRNATVRSMHAVSLPNTCADAWTSPSWHACADVPVLALQTNDH